MEYYKPVPCGETTVIVAVLFIHVGDVNPTTGADGVAIFTVIAFLLLSQPLRVWVTKYKPETSGVLLASGVPPKSVLYHFMFVPVAVRSATVAPLHKLKSGAVGTGCAVYGYSYCHLGFRSR
jgi:hypothetical protein